MLRDSIRLIQILHTLLKARLDSEIKYFAKSRILSFMLFISPWRIYSTKKKPGERLKIALEDLGPIFIKFGQLLSTRPDVVPSEIAGSLKILQDDLPHFPEKLAIEIIEKELGSEINLIFNNFDLEPLAAASIAQVYSAELKEEKKEVVVKVVRPGIKKIILRDISLMKRIAKFAEKRSEDARRLQLLKLVTEYETVILSELNMRIEASNIKQTRRNFEGNELLYVPDVYLDYCSENLLVMEKVHGIPVDRVNTFKDLGVDLKLIAERGVEIFLKQVFIDNFFHADMHPGNIFVAADGALVPIDFGIMGHLDFGERLFLARLLTAILDRDYDAVAKLHADAGMLGDHVPLAQFAQSIRAVADPVMGKALGEVSLGTVLGQVLQLSTRFEIAVQPQYNLLQKTMMMAEGVARQLNPQADMWTLARPLASDWMRDHLNFARRAEKLVEDLMMLTARLPRILDALEECRNDETPQQARQSGALAISLLALGLALFALLI